MKRKIRKLKHTSVKPSIFGILTLFNFNTINFAVIKAR